MPVNESNNLVIYSLQACAIVEKILSNSNVIYKTPKTLNKQISKKENNTSIFLARSFVNHFSHFVLKQ